MHLQSSGSNPFRYWVYDNWCQPLKPGRMADAMLHKWEVSYDNDLEYGKKTSRNFNQMLPELQDAFNVLQSDETLARFINITNVPSLTNDPIMHGAGLHLSTDGSFLQSHVDYQRHVKFDDKERRLNAILFMHDRWEDEWGGELLLANEMGEPVVEIIPKPGRLALFECGVSSYHGVRVITGKQAIRLSCAVYYLADARLEAVRKRALFFPNRNSGKVPMEVS